MNTITERLLAAAASAPPPPLTIPELVEIRVRLGLSPEQMAHRAGLTVPHYKDLERGYAPFRPLVENAIRWVEHMGGEPVSGVCQACDGVGNVRRAGSNRREKCGGCDGEGVTPFRWQGRAQ